MSFIAPTIIYVLFTVFFFLITFQISQLPLFTNKSVNDTIVDTLTLHFKWMDKHFLKKLTVIESNSKEVVSFNKYYQNLTNYVLSNYHPLNLTRKIYVKNLTNFLPYYEQGQIDKHQIILKFIHQTSLIPKLGAPFDNDALVKRINIIMNKNCQTLKQRLVDSSSSELVSWLLQLERPAPTEDFVDLDGSIDIFFDKIASLNNIQSTDIDLTTDLIEFENLVKIDTTVGIKSLKLIVEMLPLLEYFALKSFNAINSGDNVPQLNFNYFDKIQTIGVNELQILKIINEDSYKACTFLWNKVMKNVTKMHKDENTNQLKELIEALPKDFYRSYSSFDRNLLMKLQLFALNSISIQSETCFDLNCGLKSQSIGSIFTSCALSTLFDKSGHIKATGLGDLDIWRNSLKQLSQLVWNNVDLLRKEFSFE